MTLKVGCSMPLSGCRIEGEIEIKDAATAEEIDQCIREWAFENFEFWGEPK